MVEFFKNIPRPIWIFTTVWFIAGLLQAALMDLHPDEAYQWQVSRYLDWGYFHHPPMIALFIKIGYWLIPNELGVRLLTVISSSIGIPLLYKLSEGANPKTFILVFLSLILTQAGVFFAAPDAPLILFTILFLTVLKRYMESDSYRTAFLLGLIVAALMYSKYHAIVLLASCLLAVPRLMLRRSFWLIVGTSVVLFLPHVIWQFDNRLISYRFNWVIREKAIWDITVLLDYLVGQLILLGPVGLILIYGIGSIRIRDPFDKVLVSVMIGVFGFFLVLAFRGKVEANWTAIAFIPIIILGTRSLDGDQKLYTVFRPVAWVFAGVLICARCYLASPWAGAGLPTVFPLRGWQNWALAVKKKADGKPVFFSGTYQFASQYSFYSGEQGYHISPLNYNGNQFDLWDIDQKVEGKTIALILGSSEDPSKAIEVHGFKTMYCFEVENYHSYRNLRLEFTTNEYEAMGGSILPLAGVIVNQTSSAIDLDSLLAERPLKMFFYFDGDQTPAEPIDCHGCQGELDPSESKPVSFSVNVPTESGKYFIRFGLDFALGMPEQNSDFIKLNVVNE